MFPSMNIIMLSRLFQSANPYVVRLSILDDELALNVSIITTIYRVLTTQHKVPWLPCRDETLVKMHLVNSSRPCFLYTFHVDTYLSI